MQLFPIKIILNLHPPKSKVCAIKLFYSKCISCFLCHGCHSNLTLSSDTSCRESTRNSQTCEKKKNKENTCQRKIITRTRQYLRGSAICLRPWGRRNFIIIREKYKCGSTVFLSLKATSTTLIIKVAFSISCTQDSQWAIKLAKNLWLVHERYGLGLSAQASTPWTEF